MKVRVNLKSILNFITEGRRQHKRFRSGNFRDGGQEQEASDETKLEMLIEKVGEKVL